MLHITADVFSGRTQPAWVIQDEAEARAILREIWHGGRGRPVLRALQPSLALGPDADCRTAREDCRTSCLVGNGASAGRPRLSWA